MFTSLQVSDIYLLGCWKYREKHGKDIFISCGCVLLFTNMSFSFKMGLGLRQSLMVMSITSILLYANNVLLCCCLHVTYIVYKDLNTQMHIAPSKPKFL